MMQELPLNFEGIGTSALQGNNTTDHEADFAERVGGLISLAMGVAFFILLIFLIWGAFEWMTSAGDSGKLQSARNRMLHAVVGILILSSTIALFMFVQFLLGVEFLTFSI